MENECVYTKVERGGGMNCEIETDMYKLVIQCVK